MYMKCSSSCRVHNWTRPDKTNGYVNQLCSRIVTQFAGFLSSCTRRKF